MFRTTDSLLLFLAGVTVGAIVHAVIGSEVVSGQLRRKLFVRYRRLSRHVLPKNSKEKNDRDCDLVTLQKLLDAIERDILPLTCLAVCTGKQLNRCDGAAILRSSDMSSLLVTTNQEFRCHLYHAAIIAVEEFCEMSHKKISSSLASECTIILTFKPCQHCRRALAASKFGRAFYLFDTHDFPDIGSMACVCSERIEEESGETDDFYCPSIISLLKTYESNRRNERIALQEEISSSSSSQITAKDMAAAAAADNLMVRLGRRIEQLKQVYVRINSERQVS